MSGHYIGKDLVHYGSGIVLDPERAYDAIEHSARKNIRTAERQGFSILRCAGTAEELRRLRVLWYYPEDPNFPDLLAEDEILYLAFLKETLVGGMILIPVGSHLFLNNLTACCEAKKYHLPGYMLWHAVNDLKDRGYRYIDIGASYRVNLQRFFSKWSSFHYPIIFNPPELKPSIRFQLFRSLHSILETEPDTACALKLCSGRPYTIVPSMQHAREVVTAYELGWNPVTAPQPADTVQVLDLTELFPLQYGALIIGLELDAETLWSRFGCYDHFKTRYIHSCLSLPGWDIDTVGAQRASNHRLYQGYFENDDVEIQAASGWVDGFRFGCNATDSLASRFYDFGIQVRREADWLVLPCHQALSDQDIEYVYAVYRGYLNLCSEWEPTAIKGSLKLTGS